MDALILAGGEARRLHGADKPMLEVGDETLLDRVIEACATAAPGPGEADVTGLTGIAEDEAGVGRGVPAAGISQQRIVERLVVVGPRRATLRDVRFIREDPPGGGPSAAIAAGLTACSSPWVGVFAADLPFLTAEVVHSLWTACAKAGSECDGAVSLDAGGREQWLAAVYRREALLAKIAEHARGGVHGLALRKLVGDLRLVRVAQPGHAMFDCDTWEDVDAARRIWSAPTGPMEHRPIKNRPIENRPIEPLDRGPFD